MRALRTHVNLHGSTVPRSQTVPTCVWVCSAYSGAGETEPGAVVSIQPTYHTRACFAYPITSNAVVIGAGSAARPVV